MDAVKRSGEYATGQVENLLSGLGEGSHGPRVKAVKRFQEYIAAYRPEIYDDDVDLLYKARVFVGACAYSVGLAGEFVLIVACGFCCCRASRRWG
jgi:hypothetical protein